VADIKSEYLAGLKSESLAGFELECMADFIGIRNRTTMPFGSAISISSPFIDGPLGLCRRDGAAEWPEIGKGSSGAATA
jgi:hypothetical protein